MAGRAHGDRGDRVMLAALTYLAAYRRYRKLLMEAPVMVAPHASNWSFLSLLARDPRQEGRDAVHGEDACAQPRTGSSGWPTPVAGWP